MQSVKLETNILCASWNNDHTELAISPHTNEVHIYAVPHAPGSDWERLHTLTAASGLVSGVHWGARSDRIATCSHDRNAFVYVRSPTGWTPQLVRVKMGRAALCLQWNSHETKFAVGSSDMAVHVCSYDAGSRWWVSRAIRHKHSSSVVGVAWHPTLPLLATASTDRHCRVFCAGIAEVDGRAAGAAASSVFGQLLWDVEPDGSWVHSVCWELGGGGRLACCTHNSGVCVYEGVGDPTAQSSSKVAQSVQLQGLPLKTLLFLEGGTILGGGWGGCVQVVRQHLDGSWGAAAALEAGPSSSGLPAAGEQQQRPGSRVAGVQQELKAQLSGSRSAPSSPQGRPSTAFTAGPRSAGGHSKCITTIALLHSLRSAGGSSSRAELCSAGLDGRLLFWDLPEGLGGPS